MDGKRLQRELRDARQRRDGIELWLVLQRLLVFSTLFLILTESLLLQPAVIRWVLLSLSSSQTWPRRLDLLLPGRSTVNQGIKVASRIWAVTEPFDLDAVAVHGRRIASTLSTVPHLLVCPVVETCTYY